MKVFRERRLPEAAQPAGYAALIDAYGLAVPLPRRLHAIGTRNRVREEGGWRIFTPRHAPSPTLHAHLTFALKYEGLDLAVLKRLFEAVGPAEVEAMVRATPTGSYARRVWFLYEWLTSRRLDLPDAMAGPYVSVLDPKRQWAVEGKPAKRYKVRDNLPGTPAFCPLVFRTKALEDYVGFELAGRAREIVAAVPHNLIARAAAFLLLRDSKASYAIEGERPPHDRIERWGRAIGEAGRHPLDREELLRLQKIIIGDARFVRIGFRQVGGFVGEHDRESRAPLPEHISARAEDLTSLIDGLIAFDGGRAAALDPVIAAAVLAFGFVYVHPFEDGNGRIHRYLIHHVLARRGFNPPGVVFPVSASILERVEAYRNVLESHSRRLMPLIDWEPTSDSNVRVLNDTADFYRFFDATPHAEFLYGCVQKTIEEDLPREAEFLGRYDRFCERVERHHDMPARLLALLYRFLSQNEGRLSVRARSREFRALTDEECTRIEAIYQESFGDEI